MPSNKYSDTASDKQSKNNQPKLSQLLDSAESPELQTHTAKPAKFHKILFTIIFSFAIVVILQGYGVIPSFTEDADAELVTNVDTSEQLSQDQQAVKSVSANPTIVEPVTSTAQSFTDDTSSAPSFDATTDNGLNDPDNIKRHFEQSPFSLFEAKIDKVYVDKSTQKLYLLQDGKSVKSYHVALGDSPKGHKQQQGDEKTPEGNYILDWTNENSIAHRSIHVSYPNADDIANAKAKGVDPGGAIMIHGQMNGYGHLAALNQRRNWTDGCMAVTDDEMDEIMSAVKVGTPIEIVW